jgi:transposase
MTWRRHALREDQWEAIRDMLPGRRETVGVTAKDNRLFVDAVLHHYISGSPWRDLPEGFGDWKNVHRRHSRWAEKGVWKQVFERLSQVDPDFEYVMIDSTIVRVHQHAAGAKKKTPASRPATTKRPKTSGEAKEV